MDSLLRPAGREPPATYWRRRALLLVSVLLALFIGSRACGGDAAGQDGALRRGTGKSLSGPTAPEPSPSATPTGSPSGTSSPTGGPTSGGQSEGAPTEEPTQGGVAGGGVVPGYCQDGNVRISIKPTKSTFPPDQDASFRLTILNAGSGPCRFEVGPLGWEITVESGHTRIWNSDDCAVTEESTLQTLQPVDPVTVAVTWDRIRSKEGCPSGQPAASPGTYTVMAKAGNVTSQRSIFVLAD